MRPYVTRGKPPAVGLPPALRRDRFFFSSATRSDSKCCNTEALHVTHHDDLSPANVSSSFGSILHAFRNITFNHIFTFNSALSRAIKPCTLINDMKNKSTTEMWMADVNEINSPLISHLRKVTFSYSLWHKVLYITKNTVRYDVIWCIKSWSS